MFGKVERLLAMSDGLRQDLEHPEVWWVKSLDSPAIYRVQLHDGGWVSCSCPHGLNNQGRAICYHAEGVERRLREIEDSLDSQG